MSRPVRARAGIFAGGATACAGLGLAVGLAAALMAAGVLVVAYCLLLMDVDGGGP
jgi:hypothetical protein